MGKITRATRVKEENCDETKPSNKSKIPVARKVIYISESLLQDESSNLRIESFYHPGKGHTALFVTQEHEQKDSNLLMEVLEFAEKRRSWLIDNDVCSDGKIYITTPIDAMFFALHYIRKHCLNKALSLDCIEDEVDRKSVTRLLTNFVKPLHLSCIADQKTIGNDEVYYKYNSRKTMAWLALKTKSLADALRIEKVHCGKGALSQNYSRGELGGEENVQDIDYMRMACGIVGDYLDMELQEELAQYLEIPVEVNNGSIKRKSLQNLNANENKKIKLDEDSNATVKLKESDLIDKSLDDVDANKSLDDSLKSNSLKERTLTSKEKALAKSAKGTKSIASFFKK